jgi:two-component system, NarL family, response regulator EvgA
MKVLIADGSPLIQKRLGALLSEIPGIEITACASDVDSAQAMAVEHHPDVIVLDASLPRGGGIELLGRIRALGRGGRCAPVFVVLASPSLLSYRVRFNEAGAAYFFDKGRDQDRLVEAVEAVSRELAG